MRTVKLLLFLALTFIPLGAFLSRLDAGNVVSGCSNASWWLGVLGLFFGGIAWVAESSK